MDRFETVSRVMFVKMVDELEAAERWNGSGKAAPELADLGDIADVMAYERARSIWARAIGDHPEVFKGQRAKFPQDVPGIARVLRILDGVALTAIPADVKGAAYEEILRNTFEKNENQQYFTPRHVVDFVVELCDPSPTDAVCDPAAGSGGFLVAALERVAGRPGADNFSMRMRGAEVDERMAWIARINMLMHGGDPRSVHHLPGPGSLAPKMRLQKSLPFESFDLLMTNPPFGSDMSDKKALAELRTGKGRESRRRGVLFVERCLELLRPGGRLAIVLDDSVLNLPSNDDVRQIIQSRCEVEAVISLPDVTFMPYSTAKTSVVLLRKLDSAQESTDKPRRVFMADVEQVGNRPNGDPLYSDLPDDDGSWRVRSDLPEVLAAFRSYPQSGLRSRRAGEGLVFSAKIDCKSDEFEDSRLDVAFFHPARRGAEVRLSRSQYPLHSLDELVEFGSKSLVPATELGDITIRWLGLGDIEPISGRFQVREIRGDRVRSAAKPFEAGDVLFSRLRPKLRKAIWVPEGAESGIASAELMVMRCRPMAAGHPGVLPEFLAFLLRSDLVFGQLIFKVTGVGRPRVHADAVAGIRIPVPPRSTQRRLLSRMRSADRAAETLRLRAHRQLEEAVKRRDDAFAAMTASLCPADRSTSSRTTPSEQPLRDVA